MAKPAKTSSVRTHVSKKKAKNYKKSYKGQGK